MEKTPRKCAKLEYDMFLVAGKSDDAEESTLNQH